MPVRFADPYVEDEMADGTIHTESLGVDMFWGPSMIARLIAGGVPTMSVDWRHGMYVGTLLRDLDTGNAWVVRDIRAAREEDWFDDSKVAICTQPWNEIVSMMRQKIEWLEDELIPRTATATRRKPDWRKIFLG